MCRDGYRAKCALEGCDGMTACRDYTLCLDCREGADEEWY